MRTEQTNSDMRANGSAYPHGRNRHEPLTENELGQQILDWYYADTVKEFKALGPFKRMETIWDSALTLAGTITAENPRSAGEIHVLLILARLAANPDGYCYASANYIACIRYGTLEPTQSQIRSVKYALSSLRKQGVIYEREQSGKPTHRVPRPKERIDLGRAKTAAAPCGPEAPHACDGEEPDPCSSGTPLEQKQEIEACSPNTPPPVQPEHTPPCSSDTPYTGIDNGIQNGNRTEGEENARAITIAHAPASPKVRIDLSLFKENLAKIRSAVKTSLSDAEIERAWRKHLIHWHLPKGMKRRMNYGGVEDDLSSEAFFLSFIDWIDGDSKQAEEKAENARAAAINKSPVLRDLLAHVDAKPDPVDEHIDYEKLCHSKRPDFKVIDRVVSEARDGKRAELRKAEVERIFESLSLADWQRMIPTDGPLHGHTAIAEYKGRVKSTIEKHVKQRQWHEAYRSRHDDEGPQDVPPPAMKYEFETWALPAAEKAALENIVEELCGRPAPEKAKELRCYCPEILNDYATGKLTPTQLAAYYEAAFAFFPVPGRFDGDEAEMDRDFIHRLHELQENREATLERDLREAEVERIFKRRDLYKWEEIIRPDPKHRNYERYVKSTISDHIDRREQIAKHHNEDEKPEDVPPPLAEYLWETWDLEKWDKTRLGEIVQKVYGHPAPQQARELWCYAKAIMIDHMTGALTPGRLAAYYRSAFYHFGLKGCIVGNNHMDKLFLRALQEKERRREDGSEDNATLNVSDLVENMVPNQEVRT